MAVILLSAALVLGYDLRGPNQLMKYVSMVREGPIAHAEGEDVQ